MPWAIEINHNYRPPVEKVRIENAYLRFSDWSGSNGANYKDWFSNTSGSYRNSANLQ
jgi:LruC domain-containing protein